MVAGVAAQPHDVIGPGSSLAVFRRYVTQFGEAMFVLERFTISVMFPDLACVDGCATVADECSLTSTPSPTPQYRGKEED